ncbi:MAG: ATP-dependent DNA helicase RecG [Candidatus Marinimicrobia bacterium]|nr:ATP-dependent DNA helicase RecG [Candidatus Neomarinimicrobiota bacterium]
MRNENLSAELNLSTPIQYLSGIGPKRGEAFASTGVHTAGDLLYYYPRRYLDRRSITPIEELEKDNLSTVVGEVVSFGLERGRRRRFKILLDDGTGILACTWFNGIRFVQKRFKENQLIAVHSKVGIYANQFTMIHPEFDILGSGQDPLKTGAIIPVYPSTDGLKKVRLDSNGILKIIKNSVAALTGLVKEYLPHNTIDENNLLNLPEALKQIHFADDGDILQKAIFRLKFDELFFYQLLLAVRKHSTKKSRIGIKFKSKNELLSSVFKSLPFELTDSQKKVMGDIRKDMSESSPMQRLLQGDVGSGKTVVAFLASAIAIGSGYQAAIMAPTEILSDQHFQNAVKFFKDTGVKIVQLKGGLTGTKRKTIFQSLSNGESDLVIGTHALLYDEVQFKNLGFAVIDEQHRFGVEQRAGLMIKGVNPDILIMSATPIPRSLAMSIYADLDVSYLTEMPAGRRKVRTELRSAVNRHKIYEFLKGRFKAGEQAFILYPLIEESEKIDLQAAVKAFDNLENKIFPEFNLALLHGRMSAEEKETVMNGFSNGNVDALITTTVIEVGIDIPNATVMLVENAERFGLSQLHQLRGRIGRGGNKSYFIMISDSKGAAAQRRLNVLMESNDGFVIAQEDLKQRGYGDFFGKRQHGIPDFKLADIIEDAHIAKDARTSAFNLTEEDPHLRKPENRLLRDRFMSSYSDRLKFIETG